MKAYTFPHWSPDLTTFSFRFLLNVLLNTVSLIIMEQCWESICVCVCVYVFTYFFNGSKCSYGFTWYPSTLPCRKGDTQKSALENPSVSNLSLAILTSMSPSPSLFSVIVDFSLVSVCGVF